MSRRSNPIVEALRDLQREVAQLRERVQTLDEQRGELEFLSKREVAKRLGISRDRTLERMIRNGSIRTVVVPGTRRVRITSAEVARVAREGAGPPPRPEPPRSRRRTSAGGRRLADAIRALPLPTPRQPE